MTSIYQPNALPLGQTDRVTIMTGSVSGVYEAHTQDQTLHRLGHKVAKKALKKKKKKKKPDLGGACFQHVWVWCIIVSEWHSTVDPLCMGYTKICCFLSVEAKFQSAELVSITQAIMTKVSQLFHYHAML